MGVDSKFTIVVRQVALTMLRQAVRIAARQATATRVQPSAVWKQQARAFGALSTHTEKAVARPFQGASRSEPDMEYIEEPSMLYMTCLVATPWMISGWFLTKFV